MGHGPCQPVHGPLPEVAIVRQHLCHMQAVEVHLAFTSELDWDDTDLWPLQS